MVVVRAMIEEELSTEPDTRRNQPRKPHGHRQAGPILGQLEFDWKAQDKYVELLNFGMVLANVLQGNSYDHYKELIR